MIDQADIRFSPIPPCSIPMALASYRISAPFEISGGYRDTRASSADGIQDAARYQQVSLREMYHLSRSTTLHTLQAYQHASEQTPGAPSSL
ncbi:porin family protein [Paraburkholderia tropica]|nr:hypothetical protein [Paraburkholderia tropica]RQN34984.1 hypothetical protein EHZ25_31620 [Paraburkholderia tropica]